MNRRQFIAGAGCALPVSVTGCLGRDPAPADENNSNRQNNDNTILTTITSASIRTYDSWTTALRNLTSDTQSVAPSTYDLQIDIDVVQDRATKETPARIAITVENVGTDPLDVVTTAGLVVPNWQSGSSDDPEPKLFLYPTDSNIERDDDDCWLTDFPRYHMIVKELNFPAGEVIRQEFDLWGYSGDNECFPAGEYELIQQYSHADEPLRIEWGIVVELSEG